MKSFEFVFTPEIMKDIEESTRYYTGIQEGLGKKFVSQLIITLNTIKRNPFFAAVRYADIRCAQLKGFPYLLHYHVDEENMLVRLLAVYSTYRDPLTG